MFGNSEYNKMVAEDKLPVEGSSLLLNLISNPTLLLADIGLERGLRDSVTAVLLQSGSLRCIDFISHSPGADIFYCGEVQEGLKCLLYSAGINVYLASQGSLLGDSNYCQRLYWQSEDGHRCPSIIEEQSSEYLSDIVPWFHNLALSCGAGISQKDLAEYYLSIAYMETFSRNAGIYFLEKALAGLRQAFPYAMKPAEESNDLIKDYKTHFRSLPAHHVQKTLLEWQDCHREASEKAREIVVSIQEKNTILETQALRSIAPSSAAQIVRHRYSSPPRGNVVSERGSPPAKRSCN